MKKHNVWNLGILAVLFFFTACPATTTSTSSTSTSTTGLRFTSKADFSSSASTLVLTDEMDMKTTTTALCSSLGSSPTRDAPEIKDGLDCDGDSGVVAHITPSIYSIALKKVILVPSDSSKSNIDLIADTKTLAKSEVLTFTSDINSKNIITIDPTNLTAGTYSGIQMEIYYFQLTFPVAGTKRTVRIYMSDDDFAAEGSLGHHQGDITFIDDDGTERWVDSTWLSAGLTSTRTSAQNGAGDVDSETGHARGFFGDADLWNDTALKQGSGQDIFLNTLNFDSTLTIPEASLITSLTTITATISVADTFYYEDFFPQNTTLFPGFYPGLGTANGGGEATSVTTEWAPLVPKITLSVQ